MVFLGFLLWFSYRFLNGFLWFSCVYMFCGFPWVSMFCLFSSGFLGDFQGCSSGFGQFHWQMSIRGMMVF